MRDFFISQWIFWGLIIGFVIWGAFLHPLLNLLTALAWPSLRFHGILAFLLEYIIAVAIAMIILYGYWRKAMYLRAPEKVKKDLKA